MNCPGCAAAMQAIEFEGSLVGVITLDFCFPCQVIWFDSHESTQLSPGAILEVFKALRFTQGRVAQRTSVPPRLPAVRLAARNDAGPSAFDALHVLPLHLGSRAPYALPAIPAREELHPSPDRYRARRSEVENPHHPVLQLRRAHRPRARHRVPVLPLADRHSRYGGGGQDVA